MKRALAMTALVAAALGFLAAQRKTQPVAAGPIRFENVAARAGVRFLLNISRSPEKHQIEAMTSGVAVFDYDNDGWPDLYFINGATIPGLEKSGPGFWNRLFHNNRDGTFTDVTEKAGVQGSGYGMGVAAGDYDNDGFEDLYLAGVNRNQLLHNNGDGTFTDVTAKAGVSGMDSTGYKPWSIGGGWFDYDNDGRLDLLVVNYVKWQAGNEPVCKVNEIRAYCAPGSYEGLANRLYHNNGDGTFTDVTERSGFGRLIGKGMAAAFADYDGDGFTDGFISNDTYRNFLFHNNGDGTFTEVGIRAGVAYNENGKSIAGMGADFRDIDNDGRPDIFVVGMIGDTFPLFLNRGRDFVDATSRSGVAKASAGRTAWGNGVFDFDNDGWKDLFTCNASILDNSEEIDRLPSKLPNSVLRQIAPGRFEDVSAGAGAGFQLPRAHRGAAFADLDNNGKIDVVVTSQNSAPEVFLNRSNNGNHWLMLRLTGTRSNRDGLGARVEVTTAAGSQFNHATTAVGLSSSSDRRIHFGLGQYNEAARIEIRWPSGVRQVLERVAADRVLEVREP